MPTAETPAPKKSLAWIYDLLFILVLLIAAYFRFTGVNWGELQYQQPDELFLRGVTLNLSPVHSLGQYFDTAKSTLNPHNTGNGFYVYGDLPIILVRYLAGWFKQLGNFDAFGRQMSALADIGTIALLYFTVKRLYKPGVALLASLFSALAVMQIQESHYYTTDNFANFFMFLAVYFAALLLTWRVKPSAPAAVFSSIIAPSAIPGAGLSAAGSLPLRSRDATQDGGGSEEGDGSKRIKVETKPGWLTGLIKDPLLWLSAIFGIAFGMAVASKLTAAPLAVLLPVALGVRYLRDRKRPEKSADDADEKRYPLFEDYLRKNLTYLVVGGVFAILSFRVFMPYAFVGLHLNPKWLANIAEQRRQATPNADLDWALQWARRTHLYSFQNLTVWGLGLPLGILAWLGFLWMAWRMIRGEWAQHFLLWSWTAGYFLWQSLQYNPTMRYQLPIYPLLCMMAAWFIGRLTMDNGRWKQILRTSGFVLGGVVLLLTAGWAYAFLQIYTHPEPRIAASNWIFQNIPGPINLRIKTGEGDFTYQQPLPFGPGSLIQQGSPYQTAFQPRQAGALSEIYVPYAVAQDLVSSQNLQVTIWQSLEDPQPLAAGMLVTSNPVQAGSTSQTVAFDQGPALNSEDTYYLKVESLLDSGQVKVCGPIQLAFGVIGQPNPVHQTLDSVPQCRVSSDQAFTLQFTPQENGTLTEVDIAHVNDVVQANTQTVTLTLATDPNPMPDQVLATATVRGSFLPTNDRRGVPLTFQLDRTVTLDPKATYYMSIRTTGGALVFSGGTFANETDLDWSLPFRISGYDPFGGLYRGDLNLQVYWDDNDEKVARFTNTLAQADYILIPTNHQYGQITRIPERFPLTTVYYRELLGCPAEKSIIWCYEHAEPGQYHGSLGFDLVATFEDFPTLGPIQINDQAAEEAFTFYDHPKVLVFKKSAEYDTAKVQAILGAVDTSNAIHLTPGQADKYKSTLLPAATLARQQAGGTWADLFNRNALYNRYPGLGLVLWYLLIFGLGVVAYPIVRAGLPGLADHGYPLARVAGLLLWAWFAWIAGSIGLTYSRTMIGLSLLLLIGLGGFFAWRQRQELAQELRERWSYFMMVEGLFLGLFLVDLLIRIGNPDLWHPAKGGERPMDFSYFNAILKSTSFPPYDPWFANGYINYYYYGYVIVGTPVKLLGIVPSIAFNFILPTLFACVGTAAFSVGWNLLAGWQDRRAPANSSTDPAAPAAEIPAKTGSRFIGGIGAASAIILLGNLGVVRMLWQGLQRIAAPNGVIDKAGLLTRLSWAAQGFFMTLLKGAHLPYGPGDWYWIPSRALPASSGEPITEFPLFSFIYSDLHAHVIALMITILAIAWAVSVLLSRAKWKNPLNAAVGLFLGALVVGVIKPTNTWDFYTYVLLCSSVLAYSVWRYADVSRLPAALPEWGWRLGLTAGAVAALVGGSLLLYQPYNHWYLLDSGYTKAYPWTGGRSDISSYLVHWGVFLFFIVTWMLWETRQWLAETPVSALRKLRPYRDLILGAVILMGLILVLQQWWVMRATQNVPFKHATILWVAIPLAAWAGTLLLFSPRLTDAKRLVAFMVGTGLLLSMIVEEIVMGGDIGRMNTVFKIYYQAWTLLGLSAAACFAWLLADLDKWFPGWRTAWEVAATVLIGGAALFIIMGGLGKVDDRMAMNAPRGLDSMTYMNYSTYFERNTNLDLSADYRAIRWMQDNVKGSPVIAEAPGAGIQYEWFNRFSIYTGLPDVVGWEWHQMQQRVIFTATVRNRGIEEDEFYKTPDIQATLAFIRKYNVRYIIVGQLEQARYVNPDWVQGAPGCPDCLSKFSQYDGKYWHAVYRDEAGKTVIYEVNQ